MKTARSMWKEFCITTKPNGQVYYMRATSTYGIDFDQCLRDSNNGHEHAQKIMALFIAWRLKQ